MTKGPATSTCRRADSTGAFAAVADGDERMVLVDLEGLCGGGEVG